MPDATDAAPRVGIDDLNVYGSTLVIDSTVIAEARGVPEAQLRAVGFDRRSLIPPYEDAVTLAVNAARPLVDAAGRDAFDLLIVATESGLDWGKPLSSYVHRHLGLGGRCRNMEVKHACYGGTAAIQMATAWVRAGSVPGGKALVVMTDVARPHLDDPAELSAGTGAVAVSISSQPRILDIESVSGYASREVYDVARPTATGEWADAVLSLAAYLDLMEEACENYRLAAGETFAMGDRFRHLLYHTPLVALVRDVHRVLLESDPEPVSALDAGRSFDRMVGPALGYARELANIYSGSVYCLLAGLLDGPASPAPGTRIGICSYGSGSCAEIYGGVVREEARATLRRHRIGEHLADRVPVDVGRYEELVGEVHATLVARDYEPAREFVPGHFERCYAGRERLVLVGIENHYRHYGWADDGAESP